LFFFTGYKETTTRENATDGGIQIPSAS